MKVLIACEFSGVVREAFKKLGHDSWSCDLLETEIEGNHIKGDVLDILDDNWDMMIAHPPCTHIAVNGAAWFKEKIADGRQQEAIEFVETLWDADIDKIVIENPVGVLSTKSKLGKPTQIVQPYYFGHPHSKRTCLWLKNLLKLIPTKIVEPTYITFKSGKRMPKWYAQYWGNKDRAKLRSITFKGIADAMAEQWS